MTIEHHPLEPFLPPGATTLFLGSFPPPRERWSMDFFYPNYINDFWRVMGLVHFGEAKWFEIPDQVRNDGGKSRNDGGNSRNDGGRAWDDSGGVRKDVRKGFDRERIIAFCEERGLAFFDTATVVKRSFTIFRPSPMTSSGSSPSVTPRVIMAIWAALN